MESWVVRRSNQLLMHVIAHLLITNDIFLLYMNFWVCHTNSANCQPNVLRNLI